MPVSRSYDSMPQWIRRWSTKPEILGSIPSGVVFIFLSAYFSLKMGEANDAVLHAINFSVLVTLLKFQTCQFYFLDWEIPSPSPAFSGNSSKLVSRDSLTSVVC